MSWLAKFMRAGLTAAQAQKLRALPFGGLKELDLDEIGVLDEVTPGTVAAGKAVVVDDDKDVGDFRDVTVRDLGLRNATATGDLGAVNATLSGDLGGVNATLSGDLGAVNATLSGDASAVNATLSGDLNAVNSTLSGDASAVNATISGDLSAVNATFAGDFNVKRIVSVADAVPTNTLVALNMGAGDYRVAAANSPLVLGAHIGDTTVTDDDADVAVAGVVSLTAGFDLIAGLPVKSGPNGSVVSLLPSFLAGEEIADTDDGAAFANQPADAEVRVVSDDEADDQVVTIIGLLNADGSIATEEITLNGTTPVVGMTEWSHVLGVKVSGHAGTVSITVNDDPTYSAVTTVATGETGSGVHVFEGGEDAFCRTVQVEASGASTGHIGVLGVDAEGNVALETQQLTGSTTLDISATEWLRIDEVYIGDIEVDQNVILKAAVPADPPELMVGRAISSAAAGELVDVRL